MGGFNLVFQRTEKKYMLSRDQYTELKERISKYMTADDYGLSTICNVYYDTENFDLIRRSLDKPLYKEKLRLRSYGVPGENSVVFLEIKKKFKGVVYKRRISMSLKEAKAYLENGVRPREDSQILHELDYFMEQYKPVPKVYLAYDRIAYYGNSDKNVRVTFDMNIRSRREDPDLSLGDAGKLLLPEDQYLMELKLPGAMPLWMVHIINDLKIVPCSFSKYGTVYKNILLEEEENKCFRVYYKLPQVQAQALPSSQLRSVQQHR